MQKQCKRAGKTDQLNQQQQSTSAEFQHQEILSSSPFSLLTSKQLRQDQVRRESCTSISELLEAEQFPLIRLDWTTRLTIILIGASILFSMFFALEFLITKLVSGYFLFTLGFSCTSASSNLAPTATWSCHSPVNWPRLVSLNETKLWSEGRHSERQKLSSTSNKQLGVDFGLIYEDELARERTGSPLPASLRPQEKLRRILEAYHVVMPFNPDIWLLSEPRQQLHLLSGEPATCLRDLRQLHDSIKRALNGHPGLGSRGSSGSARNAEQETRWANMRQFKLLQWLDSFGRPEAGSLLTHPFWLGSFVECQQMNEPASQKWLGDGIQSRYCVGKLAFRSWPTDDHQSRVSIKVGLCLPRQCDSLALFEATTSGSNESFVKQIRQEIRQLMMINFNHEAAMVQSSGGPDRLDLTDVYCLPLADKLGMSIGGYLLVLLLVVWVALVMICTYLRPTCRNNRLLDIMALDVNLDLFMNQKPSKPLTDQDEKPQQAINLNVLDSVKHLGCVGVVGAHVLLTNLTLGTAYSHTIETIGKDMRTMMLLSLNNIVDTFFVISGLLVAYLTFKKLERQPVAVDVQDVKSEGNTWPARRMSWLVRFLKQYLSIVASRYLRMAPLYFLVYSFAKLVSVHLGEGPLWDYATNKQTLRGFCKHESWLWPVGFASDFKPLTEHCVPPAWSIAVDLQFFLFLPLLISLLYYSRRLGYLLLGLLIVLSTCCTVASYRSLLDYVSLEDFGKLRLHVFTVMLSRAAEAYSLPHNRMGPMLVGLVGGHLLFEYDKRRKSTREAWPWFMRGKWLGFALTAGLLFVLAPNLVQFRERLRSKHLSLGLDHLSYLDKMARFVLALDSSAQFDFHLALGGFIFIKPLWSICNLIVFLRLITDLNSSLAGRLMSLNMWQILAKLNYAILLIHFELIKYDQMSQLALNQPISWSFLVGRFSFAYLFSVLLGVPLFVLIEQPIQRLASACLGQSKTSGQHKGKHRQEEERYHRRLDEEQKKAD